MNRVLRRPMFRTGGSAEGLTSGLAPRQGYDEGNLANQLKLIEAYAPRTPRKDTSMRDFLITLVQILHRDHHQEAFFQQLQQQPKDHLKNSNKQNNWKELME